MNLLAAQAATAADLDALQRALDGDVRHALRLHKRLVEGLRDRFHREEAALRRTAPWLLDEHVRKHRACVLALFHLRELMRARASPDQVRGTLHSVGTSIREHDAELLRCFSMTPDG